MSDVKMPFRTLPPEDTWYRTPKFYEMARQGDQQRWLWVAEPEKGLIFGVGYAISHDMIFLYGDVIVEQMKAAAKEKLYRRCKAGEPVPEGSLWEAFEWLPVFQRNEDGTVTIQDMPDYVTVEMPTIHTSGNIDVKGLYSRPGRFIRVDGLTNEQAWRQVAEYYRSCCVSYRRTMGWAKPEIDMNAPTWPDGTTPDREPANASTDQLGPGR